MPNRTRVTVTGLSAMASRTAAFGAAVPIAIREAADRQAAGVLRDAQAAVHVETGNLRATGRVVPARGDDEVTVEVAFGGEIGVDRFVDYAPYEEELHPYLGPAASAAPWEDVLDEGLGRAVP